jgi:molecular chaperone DnaK (HSP70)
VALSSTIRTLRSRDITDAIPFNVGQPSYVSDIWTNTTVAYDVAIGGLPFFYGINNERPYERQTAPYKKQQFDNSKEPGEQTLRVGGLEANHLSIVVLVSLSLTLLLVKKLITVSVHHKVLTCGTKVK